MVVHWYSSRLHIDLHIHWTLVQELCLPICKYWHLITSLGLYIERTLSSFRNRVQFLNEYLIKTLPVLNNPLYSKSKRQS